MNRSGVADERIADLGAQGGETGFSQRAVEQGSGAEVDVLGGYAENWRKQSERQGEGLDIHGYLLL